MTPSAAAVGETVADEVAGVLLKIGAVTLSPREPYTWSSGVRSPIYCDNRKLLGYPAERTTVEDAWGQMILTRCPDVQVVAGVATAGIPHAAFLADRLHLGMVYVRPEPKEHGLGKAVEGFLAPGARAVVVEDLFSSAGSAVKAARHLRSAGAQVLAATAIVTYGLAQAEQAWKAESLPWFTLTDLSHLTRKARAMGALTENEISLVQDGMRSVETQLQQKAAAAAVGGKA